jgi:hypothetical protein
VSFDSFASSPLFCFFLESLGGSLEEEEEEDEEDEEEEDAGSEAGGTNVAA